MVNEIIFDGAGNLFLEGIGTSLSSEYRHPYKVGSGL